MAKARKIILMNETRLDVEWIVDDLKKNWPDLLIAKDNRNSLFPAEEKVAIALTQARYTDALSATVRDNMIGIEKRLLEEERSPGGVIYHGFDLQNILGDILREHIDSQCLVVCITSRLAATPEIESGFPHIRMSLLGNPAVISVPGILKGPAKSREHFYGRDTEEDIGGILDERVSQIVVSLVLQAAFYFFLGEAFCGSRNCRLFNPHWRAQMLKALSGDATLCRHHCEMLSELKD
ncbi:MAG: DUF6775 family putative metallopeptidase [Elusimicrobiota bacterium]